MISVLGSPQGQLSLFSAAPVSADFLCSHQGPLIMFSAEPVTYIYVLCRVSYLCFIFLFSMWPIWSVVYGASYLCFGGTDYFRTPQSYSPFFPAGPIISVLCRAHYLFSLLNQLSMVLQSQLFSALLIISVFCRAHVCISVRWRANNLYSLQDQPPL